MYWQKYLLRVYSNDSVRLNAALFNVKSTDLVQEQKFIPVESQVLKLKSAEARQGSKINFEKTSDFFRCFSGITLYS